MRPATLAETYERIMAGSDCDVALAEFLDTFYLTPTADARLDTLRRVPPLTGDAHLDALAGAAAFGDGTLAGALELTTGHVGTREQFGKPLASFQAVAQEIADVYIASRTMHLAAMSAAWRLSAGLDAESIRTTP